MTASSIHNDAEAGVTFPIPFPDATEKTAVQVTGLLRENVNAVIPEDAEFTSGVYAKEGLPFLLVWRRADKVPPSRADVKSLAGMMEFDKDQLRGYLKEPLPAKGGLKTLILTQIAKGETIQVGFYYKSQPDAALFKEVVQGFKLTEDKKLSPEALPAGPDKFVIAMIGLAAFLVGFGAVLISRRVYLKRSSQPSPGRGTA